MCSRRNSEEEGKSGREIVGLDSALVLSLEPSPGIPLGLQGN